jgi:acetyl esterase/lipase
MIIGMNMTQFSKRIAALGIAFVAMSSTTSATGAESELEKTTVVYREVDGHKILADVYRPKNDKVVPVIVWLHGGALIMGNREGVQHELMKLAEEKGYAVVSFDYRLAPETKLPALISDIEAGFEWLSGDGAKQFHLDPFHVVVAGGSAGGYLSLVTGYRVHQKPKAIVALFGYGNLNRAWYDQPSPHPCHNGTKFTLEDARKVSDGTVVSDGSQRKGISTTIYLYYRQQGTWPEEVSGFDPARLAEDIIPFEPYRNVTADFPPTMLIHGTLDTDVPFDESQMFAEKLEQQNIPHTLIAIENGEHGLGGGDPEKIEAAYKSMREFVDEHLTAD